VVAPLVSLVHKERSMKGAIKRIGALFYARNLEFVRDRAALVWNLAFPLLLVVGFSLIFSGPPKPLVQMGVVGELTAAYAPLNAIPLLKLIPYDDERKGQLKVRHHQLDLLLSPGSDRYWVNPDAGQGAMAEYLLRQAISRPLVKETLSGQAIRYGDWLLPGVIGMNLMFSGLFGVGFVIVRYRKNGVLKRLRATPLSAAEFLCAQLLSRIVITLVVSLLVFLVAYWLLGVPLLGSGWLLLLIALAGGAAMASLGLLIAARIQNEELASGLLNVISMPMMFLSGVWFSLEGAPVWLQQLAAWLPLSQVITAARAVMLEGAGWAEVAAQLGWILLFTLCCLTLGSALFKWNSQ
jgi:ABC-2 type transport system permease protein